MYANDTLQHYINPVFFQPVYKYISCHPLYITYLHITVVLSIITRPGAMAPG